MSAALPSVPTIFPPPLGDGDFLPRLTVEVFTISSDVPVMIDQVLVGSFSVSEILG